MHAPACIVLYCFILFVPQVVPILRAGLVLLEQAGQVLPFSQTYHVGYVRDEATLQARKRGTGSGSGSPQLAAALVCRAVAPTLSDTSCVHIGVQAYMY